MGSKDEPISAFAVYSKKRKNLEANTKASKKVRVPLKHLSSNGTTKARKKLKQSTKQTVIKRVNNGAKGSLCNGTNIVLPKKSSVATKSSARSKEKGKSIKNVEDTANSNGSFTLIQKLSDDQIRTADKLNIGIDIEAKLQRKKRKQKSKRKRLVEKSITNVKKRQSSVGQDLNSKRKTTGEEPNINSVDDGRRLFQWLISPVNIDTFFKDNWEATPLHIERNDPQHYKQIMSTPMLDGVLRNYCIQFTKNIDITSYSNGVRETHNPIGRALPSVVWDYYMNGCSVRMLNPQTYIPKLHILNATLQEYFGCFVGANSYLTPPNSQGFAPHYDDIEAFILQIEGKKRWRLYEPRNENESLPRFSSKNFDPSEIGEPILDTVVNAGDLLYFPRGFIHQGETIDDTHSLHITLSVYQKNTWGDYLEKLLPEALKRAIETNVQFRQGLPLGYLRDVGLAHSMNQSNMRTIMVRKTRNLLNKLIEYIDVDKAADEMAKDHTYDFLPPVFTLQEKQCSVYEDGERMVANGTVVNRVEIEPDTKIKLLRAHCVRLIEEKDTFRLYYSCENSKEYHEFEPQFLEVSNELVPAIKEIILRYPQYVTVRNLPIEGEDNQIQVVKDLWEKGIVVTDRPLPIVD